ncbi:MAG TPA: sensor domain-containing diguanylate cyclase, partial [Neobacillus sp.]
IFVVENGVIVEFNNSFIAFTGIDKYQQAPKIQLLSSYFVEDPNYFYPKEKGNWIEELMSQDKHYAKVRWRGKNGETIVYLLKASPIPAGDQILFVCTDITTLEVESKKKELLAMMDPLTNSYNRLKFEELLEDEMRRSDRYDHPFSIILMDIDHFNNVNEQYGHQEGDEVLRTLSTIVQQRIRECDIFGRWGGEEFIIFTETDAQGAKKLADSIRLIIQDVHFQNVGHLTSSFGIAEFSSGKSKRELIFAADQALILSKSRGRNCVSISTIEG